MKAMVYRRSGGPEVIEAEDLEIPKPGAGEVLVRVAVSGVNPTDWKSRQGTGSPPDRGWQIPNQDGAGLVTEVGEGVDPGLAGQRVWLWESAYQRPWGTAAQYTVVPESRVVPLHSSASYELGAALGVPFITAHSCLTAGATMPDRLAPGALAGRTVLVAGGAGAVGNAAIQLARWAGATVVATVSSPEKAKLAEAAGTDHVIDYRRQDVVSEVRKIAPDGVDVIVEVAAAVNAEIDAAVLALNGCVAIYAGTGDEAVTVNIRSMMMINARWQFILLYTMPAQIKAAAVESIQAAVAAGAVRIGDEAGLPLYRFELEQTSSAHAAVAAGAVGKVLITINDDPTIGTPTD
ncbi:MAG TPA: NADPH:quinone reductase [Kineosporiaceae bacterium]|nr:NADPH:quinone reductase [Kineosporiaceae bacterium]